jgi:hypothetical protein
LGSRFASLTSFPEASFPASGNHAPMSPDAIPSPHVFPLPSTRVRSEPVVKKIPRKKIKVKKVRSKQIAPIDADAGD